MIVLLLGACPALAEMIQGEIKAVDVAKRELTLTVGGKDRVLQVPAKLKIYLTAAVGVEEAKNGLKDVATYKGFRADVTTEEGKRLNVVKKLLVRTGRRVDGVAGARKAKVALTLESASAARDEDGDVLFTCKATIENNTGAPLTVRSNFFSAFDGMTLVVQDVQGKELKKQAYTWHQSPTSVTTNHPLATGKTTASIIFPVQGLPKGLAKFKLRVVGALPGSGYEHKLSSQLLEVRVEDLRPRRGGRP
jgi:hypothetical protein